MYQNINIDFKYVCSFKVNSRNSKILDHHRWVISPGDLTIKDYKDFVLFQDSRFRSK